MIGLKVDYLLRKLPAKELWAICLCSLFLVSSARPDPWYQTSGHNQGNIQMTVSNSGGFDRSRPTFTDPFTGEKLRGLVYPAGIGIFYFEGTFAVGAIIGNDTLVTSVEEFAPAAFPFDEIELK